MIRVTKMADYGVLLMTWFSHAQEQHNRVGGEGLPPAVAASDLARDTGLPAPTVSKLLRLFAKHDLLSSVRGAHGGYRLARPASEITVANLIEAIEGPIAMTECLNEAAPGPACDVELTCPTRANWERINHAIRGALGSISLAEMAQTPVSLAGLEPVEAGATETHGVQTAAHTNVTAESPTEDSPTHQA